MTHGEIGDNWTKISEGRDDEQMQGHLAELCESDLGLLLIEHSKKCSVCRNLQIMLGDIIVTHAKETELNK